MIVPRPPFISEREWEGASEQARIHWHALNLQLDHVLKHPLGRGLVRWIIDDLCGVSAALPDEPDAQQRAEGARRIGIRLQVLAQTVAPRLWMRSLQEETNLRAGEQPRPAPE